MRVALTAFILLGLFGTALHARADNRPTLTLYTYDSFVAEGGPGPALFPNFEKHCHCQLKAISLGDAGQLANRLELDARRNQHPAQVIVGIDPLYWEPIKPWIETWGKWKPTGYPSKIRSEIRVEEGFLPYDYGVLTFLVNEEALTEKQKPLPRTFQDLLQPHWRKSLLLQDPRTSSIGLHFLAFTELLTRSPQTALGGLTFENLWAALRPQWLTLSPSWEGAYPLFLRKEAPLVWSYITSEAYHRENSEQKTGRLPYRALLFEEGHPIQIEGAALIKNAFHTDSERILAQQFLSFLISREAQEILPKTNWMLPVRKDAQLPASFRELPQPQKLHRLMPSLIQTQELLHRWKKIVVQS